MRSRNAIIAVLLLLGTALLRVAVLLTTESHVDGDEAVVGVMARHIVVHGARPVFYWGQAYGGGGAMEAWLAVLPLAVFGVSSVSLKLVALAFSLAGVGMTYRFCLRYYGPRAAVIATGIFATTTPLVAMSLKVRGGYAALPLFSVLVLSLYARMVRGQATRLLAIVFGVAAGAAYYSQELIAPLLLVLLAAAVSVHRRQWSPSLGAHVLLGVLIGAAPLVHFNVMHGFANLQHMLTLETHGGGSFWSELRRLFTYALPRFYVPRNADSYVPNAPLRAWVEYGLSAVLVIHAAAVSQRRGSKETRAFVGLLAAIVAVHLVAVASSGRAHLSPRYLLPIYPAVAILAGVSLDRLMGARRRVVRALGCAGVLSLLGLGIGNHVAHLGPSQVVEQVILPAGNYENRWTSGDAVPQIIAHLREREIGHVHTAHFLQWRLLFESEETILASSVRFLPRSSILPDTDQAVSTARRAAFVFHRASGQLPIFETSLARSGIVLERRPIREFVVFTPLEQPAS